MKKLKKIIRLAIVTLIIPALVVGFRAVIKSDNYLRDRAVKLSSEQGSCSGEQVRAPSGKDYILTAGHCRSLQDETGSIKVTKEDGSTLMRHIIAEDPASDLLLLEGLPNLEGLTIALYSEAKDHIRTFTHGRGYDTYKTEGVLVQDTRLQVLLKIIQNEQDEASCKLQKMKMIDYQALFFSARLCILDVVETVYTAMTVPGSSGGMIVNDFGHLVGVVSAGGEGFGYMVPTKDIRAFLYGY